MLGVLWPRQQAALVQIHALGIAQGQIQRQVRQAFLQLRRTHGQHNGHDARMQCLQLGCKTRQYRNRSRYSGNAQPALGCMRLAFEFLLQYGSLTQHPLCRHQHPLAFGGQASKIAVTLDDDNIELRF